MQKFNPKQLERRLLQMVLKIPLLLGNEAVNFFQDRFTQETWIDKSRKRWKPRKNKADKGRGLLIKSGRLRRSIRISRLSAKQVTISTDVPYAQIHNEGGTINHPGGTPYIPFNSKYTKRKKKGRLGIENQMVFLKKDGSYPDGVKFTKPHPIPMPQRQFMGDSAFLKKKLERTLKQELEKALK